LKLHQTNTLYPPIKLTVEQEILIWVDGEETDDEEIFHQFIIVTNTLSSKKTLKMMTLVIL